MKKALSLAILLLGCIGIFAENVKVDGIYYGLNTTDNTAAVTYYSGFSYSGDIVIPESINYSGSSYNVTSIREYAFQNCTGLTSITIPNSVTSIGGSAFGECTGLTSVTIPNSVTSINQSAFYHVIVIDIYINIVDFANNNPCYIINAKNCHYIYEGKEIQDGFVIPNTVTSIGACAFYNCTALTSVTIPNSVTSIGSSAFSGCTGLTSIAIPNSVTSIGNRAFEGCTGLTSITIPNSVTSIEERAFEGCTGLTSITMPSTVTSIRERAFYGCTGLTSVTMPNSVTSIEGGAFYGCSGLTSVTIPNSVTSIGERAFIGCTGLTSVKYTTTRPFNIGESCFPQEVYDNAKLIVAKGYLPTVGSLDGWRKFKNIVEAGATPKQDVNGDGKVNTADVVAIYEYIINGE